MHIRKATLPDTNELAQIDKACFPKQASLADSFGKMVRDPHSHLWLAEINSIPVGYILGIQQDGKTDHTITLQTGEDYVLQIAAIAVLPEYSGQQIGQKLLNQLEQSQDVRKISRFISEIALDNIASEKLFAKAGYKHSETLTDYYGEDKHARRMQKLHTSATPSC